MPSGQPYSEEILAEAEAVVREMLARRNSKGDVKRTLRSLFAPHGGICHQRIEQMVSKVRAEARERIERDRKDLIAEAVELYEAMIRDEKSTNAERITAQRAIDDLLGLKQQFEQGDTTELQVSRLKYQLNQLVQAVKGNPLTAEAVVNGTSGHTPTEVEGSTTAK